MGGFLLHVSGADRPLPWWAMPAGFVVVAVALLLGRPRG